MIRPLALVLFFAAAGCANNETSLPAEYLNNARKLGLIPIYPPGEDFQVGDVFLIMRTDDPNEVARYYVGYYEPAIEAAEEHMKTRLAFQRTITASAPGSNKMEISVVQEDLFNGELRNRGHLNIDSLPVAAIPGFTADAGYSAGSIANGLLQSIGLLGSQRTKVTLNFVDVRSYWLEPLSFKNISSNDISDFASDTLGKLSGANKNQIAIELCKDALVSRRAGIGNLFEAEKVKFEASLVTRVYLTRKIDYTYRNSQIIGAGLRMARDDSKGTLTVPQVIINNAPAVPAGAELDNEVGAINDAINSALNSSGEGVGLRYSSWNALGLTFSEIYARPVAIAYESYDLKARMEGSNAPEVEPSDGDLYRLANGEKSCSDILEMN
jgi:hypothetical protein